MNLVLLMQRKLKVLGVRYIMTMRMIPGVFKLMEWYYITSNMSITQEESLNMHKEMFDNPVKNGYPQFMVHLQDSDSKYFFKAII